MKALGKNLKSVKIILLTFIIFSSIVDVASADLDLLYSRAFNSNANILDESRVCTDEVSGTYNCFDLTGQNYGSYAMDAKDYDNDGDTDIIAIQSAPFGSSRICLNDGSSVFACSPIPSSSGYSTEIDSADFDNDGDYDAVISYSTQANRICLNNGNAVFTCSSFGPVGQSSAGLSINNLNGDTFPDIAISRQTYGSNTPSQGGNNTVCFGNGDGTFSCSDLTEESYFTQDVVSADFNNDTFVDLFFVNMSVGSTVDHSICFNNGLGNFTCSSTQINAFNITVDTGVTAADLNNDGNIDIALADQINRSTGNRICYNNGLGVFSCSLALHVGAMSKVDSGDIDNNGYVDLAYASVYANKKSPVCYNSSSGFNCVFVDQDLGVNNSVKIADIKNTPIVVNTPPNFNQIGNQTVTEGSNLEFDIVATDLNNDEITYSATNLPSGAQLNYSTGSFSWIPSFTQAGTYTVTFTASDGALTDSETIDIVVANANRAPVLDTLGNKIIAENQTLTFILTANDPDGGTLTYSALNLPSGATFSGNVFTWTPTFAQAGNYENIEFTVADNGSPMELDVELITITVGDVNRAPELSNPGPKNVIEGNAVIFTITATDPDGDNTVLSVTNLPSGATFNSGTGVFNWTPSNSQSGIYTPTFSATDNGTPIESSSVDVVITVGDDPTPTEQAQIIIDLVVTFNLPNNVTNSYMANLQKIAPFIQNGQIQPALNQLNAFINKVNQDYSQNKITLAQKNQLIALAQGLIADLQ